MSLDVSLLHELLNYIIVCFITMFFFFLLDSSSTTSKLNVLVNKLHEYLAHSTVEDSNGTLTPQDADGMSFI